jgi:hypothetical protein|tara:strand:- start:3839 stop:4012 length:174 start_codon:yes stop_codon:yes gene_type:complete
MLGLSISISNSISTNLSSLILPGGEIAEAYSIRVIADGGVVESLDCVIDGINNLAKI